MPINFAFPDSLIFWTAGRVSVRINSGLGANSKSWTCKRKHKINRIGIGMRLFHLKHWSKFTSRIVFTKEMEQIYPIQEVSFNNLNPLIFPPPPPTAFIYSSQSSSHLIVLLLTPLIYPPTPPHPNPLHPFHPKLDPSASHVTNLYQINIRQA